MAKLKKCKVCRREFTPIKFGQVVCLLDGYKCANEYAEQQRAKKEKKEKREFNRETKRRKEALKTKPQLTKELQKAFNRFIRARDRDQPCISCDAPPSENKHLTGSGWDCGHYRSVGSAPELRFEELNAHKQCVKCNQHLGGNVVEYRKRLIERIGPDKLEWLEGHHESPNYTHDELREKTKYYNAKARELEKENN